LCLPNADASLIQDLATRTEPDAAGFRALWQLNGREGSRGRSARTAAAQWADSLPRDVVAGVVLDTPLQVPELGEEHFELSTTPDLEALHTALTVPWLKGLELNAETAIQLYSRRPLTAESVRVLRLVLDRPDKGKPDILLADAEPCLAWHDSRGVVALLDWFGRGETSSALVRLLHGFLRVMVAPKADPCARKSKSTKGLSRLVGCSYTSSSQSIEDHSRDDDYWALDKQILEETRRSWHPRRHPHQHSRASVEAVECLLCTCPRLARGTIPLEQVVNTIDMSGIGQLLGVSGEPSSPGGLGRLLPLQTLCLNSGSFCSHTAALARALLRRAPESPLRPLPRALRRNVRGNSFSIFVCNAATAVEHRLLAAEELGEDTTALRELQRALGECGQAAVVLPPPGSDMPTLNGG